MEITIVSQPAAIFPAYNPALLVLTASNSETSVEMHLVIDGVSVTHHKREFFSLAEPLTDNFGVPITDNDGMPIPIGGDPVAVFDLGKLARNYFSNALVEVNADANMADFHVKAYADRRLHVKFTAEITGVRSPTFTAVNAALAPGLSEADYSAWQGKILSEMPSFKYYEGFTDKSKLPVLFGTTAADRSVVFIGPQHIVSTEIELTGTGASAGEMVYLQVYYSTGGSYYVGIYEEVVGHTAVQAAQAMYDTAVADDFLPQLVDITHTPGTNKVKFTAIDWGFVTGMEGTASIDSGFSVTGTNVDASNQLSVTTEGVASVVEVSMNYPSYFNAEAVVVNEGTEQTDFKTMSSECLPSSPFYVRWVNRIGGREHWMFSRRQTDKTDVDNSVTYDPRIETNADLGRFPRQISLTSEHTVVVGAEGIPNAEYDVLRRITTSPLIEYYDEEITEWRVITVKSGATSKDTASPVQSIELEFALPSPALQF